MIKISAKTAYQILAAILLFILFLFNPAMAENISVHRSACGNIIQVISDEAYPGDNVGDIFYNYRHEGDKWFLYKIAYAGSGRYRRVLMRRIADPETEIPVFSPNIDSLYHDSDPQEESLVADFADGTSEKEKNAWIARAKAFIESLCAENAGNAIP